MSNKTVPVFNVNVAPKDGDTIGQTHSAGSGIICLPSEHEWIVFSTALAEVRIMVQCVECGAHGTVDDPTKDEWADAFHAPSQPYLWDDNSRVTIRHLGGPCFIERNT